MSPDPRHHDPGIPERAEAREERDRLYPHRRASWAAGSAGGANGCVVVYGALVAAVLASAWAAEGLRGSADWRVSAVYGAAVLLTVLATALLVWSASLLNRGTVADGQGSHLGLLLGAGGAFIVGFAPAAFGLARASVAAGGWGPACTCISVWPVLVTVMNLWVLLRHGTKLRRDDSLMGPGG